MRNFFRKKIFDAHVPTDFQRSRRKELDRIIGKPFIIIIITAQNFSAVLDPGSCQRSQVSYNHDDKECMVYIRED